MNNSHDVPFGYWLQDSGARYTYHINKPNLDFKASFSGSLLYHTGDEWIALDKDKKELGAGSLLRAKHLVEQHVQKNTRR